MDRALAETLCVMALDQLELLLKDDSKSAGNAGMARREKWIMSFVNKSHRTKGFLNFCRQRRDRFFTLRLIVVFLFFCLILYFYIRCYRGITTVFQYQEIHEKVEVYEQGRLRENNEHQIAADDWPSRSSKASFNLRQNSHMKEPKYENTYIEDLYDQFDKNENPGNTFSENHIVKLRKFLNDFTSQWMKYSRAGLGWKEILNPCRTKMEWKAKTSEFESINRTSGNTSEITSLNIRPAGEFSRIFIRSRTADGRVKTQGGDSWRVYVTGPSSLVAKVFDYGNGTYEAMFLAMEPGKYVVAVILDYSLCDGLRDPPVDWFIKGNKQGKYQKDGSLGKLDDFLFQRLGRSEQPVRPLTINVPAPRLRVEFKDLLVQSTPSVCQNSCRFLWNGYGRWSNDTWIPFFQGPLHWHNYPQTSPVGTLWVYGDSVAMILVQSMEKRSVCTKLFKQCKLSYNWIYPILNGHKRAIEEYDDLDFDEERVLRSIRKVLSDPDMDSNSTLLLNLGLHFVMTINFTTYQKLIDHVITMLTEKKPGSEHELWYEAKVVWKSTTAILKENASDQQLTHFRFLTSQRILLFNAYATWAMCKAGIDVIDVHPITDSYPEGPMDVVHYYGFVTYPLEQRLEALKINAVSADDKQDDHTIQMCIKD